jgi:hypothetical protein
MYNSAVVYTEDNSIPMGAFVKAANWISSKLHAQEIALVPQSTVFYALDPQLRNNLKDYKTIWDSAGVILRANTTDEEVMKVSQNLIDFIEKNKQLKYLVIDWSYPYSKMIFKTISCADLGDDFLVQAKVINFVQPHTGWNSKISICQPIALVNSTDYFSDNFDDNFLDKSHWQLNYMGIGPMVNETNQRLEILIPANIFAQPINSSQVLSGITSACNLRGDFDFQVDYELLEWPPSNGVHILLDAHRLTASHGHLNDNVVRASLPNVPKDIYFTDFGDGVYQVNATSDKAGKLKIVRSGSMITGYYYSDSSRWTLIHSTQEEFPTDISIKLGEWSERNIFANRQAKIAFDNFILNRGQLVNCQPQ